MIRERNSSETTVGLFITLETVADDTPAKRATSRKVTPEVRDRFPAACGSAASTGTDLLFAMRGDGRVRGSGSREIADYINAFSRHSALARIGGRCDHVTTPRRKAACDISA